MHIISISKLIKKSINQKLPPKLFISLFNKLIKKQSINNEEFINELLILDYDQHTCSSFSSLKVVLPPKLEIWQFILMYLRLFEIFCSWKKK